MPSAKTATRYRTIRLGLGLACALAGLAMANDTPSDLDALRAQAAGGDAAAATTLAEALLGDANGQATAEVVALLEQGAAAAEVRAQAILGALYLFGAGVQADAQRAVALLGPAAAAGDNEARFNLALAHEYGAGVEQSLERALALLKEAAGEDFGPALGGVGIYYLKGLGVAADPREAARWFERGVAAGDANSAFHLAELLLAGSARDRDVPRAVGLLDQAAEGGNEAAALRLAGLLLDGKEVKADPERARGMLERFAQAGRAHSAWLLGRLLDEGKHVPADPEAAVRWLTQAAHAGLADAQFRLAEAYRTGRGVAPDPALHVHWIRQAAAAGNLAARLALVGIEGERRQRESVHPDVIERVRAAAEAGEAGAQFELGLLALHGRGMARDVDAAERWLRPAAEAGVVAAQRELGRLLQNDEAPPRRQEGSEWLASAAEAGDDNAQFLLGRALQFGIGVRADIGRARVWFEKAALQDHRDASVALAQIGWMGNRREREAALAWLLLPPGHDRVKWLRLRAGDYARGEDGKTPADPAFAMLMAGIAAALGDADAPGRQDEIAGRLDARQRQRAEQALAQWEALRTEPHPQLVWRMAREEVDRLRSSDAEAAGKAVTRALESTRKAFGARSLPHADALELEGDLARARRDAAASRDAYQRALAIRMQHQPADHPDVTRNRHLQATLHGMEKQWSAEAEMLLDLLPDVERRHGAGAVSLASYYEDLGDALYFADRATDALPYLRRSLALIERDPDEMARVRRVYVQEGLARTLARAGQPDEAILLLQESIASLREADPDAGMDLYSPLSRLVLLLWGEKRLDDAAQAQAELVALLEAERPEDEAALAVERDLLERLRGWAAGDRSETTGPDREALLAAAEAGDTSAQFELASHLLMGNFGEPDPQAALKWYRRAAEGGDAVAQYNLGILLGGSHGIAPDRKEAVAWLRLAVEQDFPDALATLGYYLTDGEDGNDDFAEAVTLFERSAALGSAVGKFNLGNHLIDGLGIEQDVQRGIALYREAADEGFPEAIRALALAQLGGRHMPVDAEAGLRGLLRAARLGDPVALTITCQLRDGGSTRYNDTPLRLPEGEALDPAIASQCVDGD